MASFTPCNKLGDNITYSMSGWCSVNAALVLGSSARFGPATATIGHRVSRPDRPLPLTGRDPKQRTSQEGGGTATCCKADSGKGVLRVNSDTYPAHKGHALAFAIAALLALDAIRTDDDQGNDGAREHGV